MLSSSITLISTLLSKAKWEQYWRRWCNCDRRQPKILQRDTSSGVRILYIDMLSLKCHKLISCSLHANNITDAGVYEIVKGLESNETLRELE